MQKDLSQGKVFATMSLFALPMLLGNVLQQAYNVVDTWWLAGLWARARWRASARPSR